MQIGADNFQQLFPLAVIAEAMGGFVELFPIRCFLSGSLSLLLFRLRHSGFLLGHKSHICDAVVITKNRLRV